MIETSSLLDIEFDTYCIDSDFSARWGAISGKFANISHHMIMMYDGIIYCETKHYTIRIDEFGITVAKVQNERN